MCFCWVWYLIYQALLYMVKTLRKKTSQFYSETQTEQKYDTLGKDADIFIAKNMKFCSF